MKCHTIRRKYATCFQVTTRETTKGLEWREGTNFFFCLDFLDPPPFASTAVARREIMRGRARERPLAVPGSGRVDNIVHVLEGVGTRDRRNEFCVR